MVRAMLDTRKNVMLPRDRLIDFILGRPEPVIVLDAAAGMGKSTLLSEIARRTGSLVYFGEAAPIPSPSRERVLWDVPPAGSPRSLPEACASGDGRIIIAKRRETSLPGLARALAYGRAFVVGTGHLLFSQAEIAEQFGADAERIMQDTGGWPLLVAHFSDGAPDNEVMREFLKTELLAPLPSAPLVNLRALISGAAVVSDDEELLPFVHRDASGRLRFAVDAVRQPLSEALDMVLLERIGIPAEAKAIAEAHAARGQMTEAILAFQSAGFFELALRVFSAADGQFFIYRYGPEAFDRVLAGFPSNFAMQSEVIVMSLALQALKRGDVSRARRLLADRFGDQANDPADVFSPRSVFSRDFRAFRLVMLIYEDVLLTDELLEQVFALLPEFPADAHFLRGSFYNSVLEFYIRGRRFAEAEDVAQRAHYHYEQAHAPILSFYISLHQAIMRLMMGDALTARKHASDAGRFLASISFESPNDVRLLTLLNACIEYEGGKAEPLAQFLSLELDDFSHGEIWPSLIEFALQYGSQALSEHFSTIAARSFLDRWRIYQIRNRQFRTMIEIREAAVLQNGNRWQEAAEKLSTVSSRITKAWVLTATDELARLHDRDEIALALIWLRHLVYEMPTRTNLDRQLSAMRDNLHLTERQRIDIDIWLAHVFKRQRDLTKARALLQKTFENAARLGAVAPLAEERVFLAELIENQRIGEFLDTSAPVRQIMRRLRDTGGFPNTAFGAKGGLSRRETKILLMICEGAANKFVANALGLSEATVKFHLGNIYRKLGCKKRREAISAARALGFVT
jgi:ATP/maltotriose-dependent transcriptional regulator MalT